MDRDCLPLPDPRYVYRVGLIGMALCAVAAIYGFAMDQTGHGTPSYFYTTKRLILVAIGALTVGAAISLRPGLSLVWSIAAGAALFASVGLPQHWDSARMLARVMVAIAGVASALIAASKSLRYWILSFVALVHFGGIFMATTWPNPTPWLTQQIVTRFYLPYLTITYLKNAYHFYSPDPGPASLLFCLVTFEHDQEFVHPKTKASTKTSTKWITLPNRQTDWKDPLGLEYYRRLSITEQVNGVYPEGNLPSAEKKQIEERRKKADAGLWSNYPQIPIAPEIFEVVQFRMPNPNTARNTVPSFAGHILHNASEPGRIAKSVKIYRLEHKVTTPTIFAQGAKPNHPTSFRPFYFGEYALDTKGIAQLVDTQDPLLYWLVPILPMAVPPNSPKGTEDFKDYMSIHAKTKFEWAERMP